ncbi:MAG TPA: ABC transporter permease [Acidimicrobiales bacterium]|nr:ABC transporter permease [Acidimicrobiales bacterium]
MTTVVSTPTPVVTARPVRPEAVPRSGPGLLGALRTLAARRFALTARTPREILVPLSTPVLFALVIAPALDSIGPSVPGIDYMSYAALGTAGLLIPLNCLFSGVGVIVDRDSGARRDLLAAPIPRSLLVAGNFVVALAITGLQLGVLLVASVLRGAEYDVTVSGLGWVVGASLLLAVAMYGVAEAVANRMPSVEEFTGALPGLAIVPWFFAGSLFPITALPAGLTAVAKVLPLTHTLALLRYGLLDDGGAGLHDIWGMTNTTAMATLSLGVVALFALVLTTVSVRVFTRSAVS